MTSKRFLSFLFENFENFISVYRATKNWIETSLFLKGIINKSDLIFRNSNFIFSCDKNKRDIAKALVILAGRHSVKFSEEYRKINDLFWIIDKKKEIIYIPPAGIAFTLDSLDGLIFAETFVYDIHFVGFDLKDKVVVEAGAFVGDTALYYASKGAFVYSFEPEPNLYEKAIKNIELNPKLSKRIVIKNYAIGKDGFINFPIGLGGGGSAFSEATRGYHRVRSISISSILKEFEINNPYLLHLDIKGSEFEIIKDRAISEFERVRIEYSTSLDGKKLGELKILIKKLQDYGFKNIRVFKHNFGFYPIQDHGTIEASK